MCRCWHPCNESKITLQLPRPHPFRPCLPHLTPSLSSPKMADPSGLGSEGMVPEELPGNPCHLEIVRNYEVIPAVICSMCCLFGIIYCFFGKIHPKVKGQLVRRREDCCGTEILHVFCEGMISCHCGSTGFLKLTSSFLFPFWKHCSSLIHFLFTSYFSSHFLPHL